ncbi:MAG: 50S ribosomal protein L17 [Phototrophicales bacterium]|nr:50S ribosomal protein L17 [Phototrophicales bacterium]
MRHNVYGKKLSRDSAHRKALRMNLTREILEHGRIETTHAKAVFARRSIERMITIAKRGLKKAEESNDPTVGVHARRIAASRLGNDRDLVKKLFDEIAPRFANREGGYTRIYKLGPRKGDNAPMVLIELTERE